MQLGPCVARRLRNTTKIASLQRDHSLNLNISFAGLRLLSRWLCPSPLAWRARRSRSCSGTDACVAPLRWRSGFRIHGNVALDVELSLAPVVVHVSNFSEHGALRPCPVVRSDDGPHASNVPTFAYTIRSGQQARCRRQEAKFQTYPLGSRPSREYLSFKRMENSSACSVLSVHSRIFLAQYLRSNISIIVRERSFTNHTGAQTRYKPRLHSHESRHFPPLHHFQLSSIPKFVVGQSLFQLRQRVHVFTLIFAMFRDRFCSLAAHA